MKITNAHLDAIRKSSLRLKLLEHLAHIGFLRIDLDRMTSDELDTLHDACLDFLMNEAPEVEAYQAQQDFDPYRILIRGVPGAYFVASDDRDPEGLFATVDEARACLTDNYWEFLLDPDE